jgi:hypothetical protein
VKVVGLDAFYYLLFLFYFLSFKKNDSSSLQFGVDYCRFRISLVYFFVLLLELALWNLVACQKLVVIRQ